MQMILLSYTGYSANIKVALANLKVYSQDNSVEDMFPKFPLLCSAPKNRTKNTT